MARLRSRTLCIDTKLVATCRDEWARYILSLIIGLLSGLYIFFAGLLNFGVPPSVGAWTVHIAQFIAVSAAVAAAVGLIQACSEHRTAEGRRKL